MIDQSKNNRLLKRNIGKLNNKYDSVLSKYPDLCSVEGDQEKEDQSQCKRITKQKFKNQIVEKQQRPTKKIKETDRYQTFQKKTEKYEKQQNNKYGRQNQLMTRKDSYKCKESYFSANEESYSNIQKQFSSKSNSIDGQNIEMNQQKKIRSKTQQKRVLDLDKKKIKRPKKKIYQSIWKYYDKNVYITDKTIEQITFQGQLFLLVSHHPFSKYMLLCGKCNKIFSINQLRLNKINERNIKFIKHCLLKCQEVAHPNSSHFIMAQDELQEAKQQLNKKVKFVHWYKNDPNALVHYIRQFLKCKNIDVVGSYTRDDGKFDGLKKCIIQHFWNKTEKVINSQLCFECGEKVYLSNYANHLVQKHNKCDVLIIIKIEGLKNNIAYLNVHQKRQNQIWFCPCRYGFEFTWEQFIKHVIKIHKGISMPLVIH